MTNSTSEAVTPPAYMKPARPRSSGWLAVLSVIAVLTGLLALAPLGAANAEPSGWSQDNYEQAHYQLVSGELGVPLWLGVESGVLDGRPGLAHLCYGTGDPNQSKTAGGVIGAEVSPWSNGVSVYAHNSSDSNGANRNNAYAFAWPTYELSPGGTSGGQALNFWIPVGVCSGPCQPGVQPADQPSGLIVGTIQQTPTSAGGTSASYRVTQLCLRVDGADVLGRCGSGPLDAGATTTGTDAVTSQAATPGPCVLGSVCAPSYNYVGTTGNQIATIYVPGLGPIPVYGVHTCLYTKDTNTQCPA